jgi:hypothetical protein
LVKGGNCTGFIAMGYGRENDRDDQNQAIGPKGERIFIHSLKSIRSSPIFQPMNRNMMYNLSGERKYPENENIDLFPHFNFYPVRNNAPLLCSGVRF